MIRANLYPVGRARKIIVKAMLYKYSKRPRKFLGRFQFYFIMGFYILGGIINNAQS